MSPETPQRLIHITITPRRFCPPCAQLRDADDAHRLATGEKRQSFPNTCPACTALNQPKEGATDVAR